MIYGKHPAYGDFLAEGLPHEVFNRLDRWLEKELPELKRGLGDDWEAAWAAAPVLSFWLGSSVVGAPLTGILVPSRDKVGRRYPLIFGLTGQVSPPPVHKAHDEAPYEVLARYLAGFRVPDTGLRGVATLLEGFREPEWQGAPFEAGQDATIWGYREDGDMSRLFRDAARADADNAQLARSHWWHAARPERAAGWLSTDGLPDAEALRWLLTERRRISEPGSKGDGRSLQRPEPHRNDIPNG